MTSLCGDLRIHTITDVNSQERVSILLKESLIGSFQPKDRAFVQQFTESQMFSEYSDSVLSYNESSNRET